MYSCEICSKSFSRRDNMLRHKKTMHEETDSETEDMESTDVEPEAASDSTDENDEELDPWQSIIDRTFERCQGEFEDRVEGYKEANGVETNVAREKIFREMRPVYRKKMAGIFTDMAEWVRALLKDPVYLSIKKTATDLKDLEEYDAEEAWKYAIKKRKFLFDKILREYNPPETTREQKESSDEADGEQRGGGLKPWLNVQGETPLQRVDNWVKSELDRIHSEPQISMIQRR